MPRTTAAILWRIIPNIGGLFKVSRQFFYFRLHIRLEFLLLFFSLPVEPEEWQSSENCIKIRKIFLKGMHPYRITDTQYIYIYMAQIWVLIIWSINEFWMICIFHTLGNICMKGNLPYRIVLFRTLTNELSFFRGILHFVTATREIMSRDERYAKQMFCGWKICCIWAKYSEIIYVFVKRYNFSQFVKSFLSNIDMGDIKSI